MNEEAQKKSGIDERKKTALLRYVAILFAVAFVFVLFSMMMQMRDTKSTISELNQSSASALQKAEALQETNQALEEDNKSLKEQLEELTTRSETLEAQLSEEKTLREELEAELELSGHAPAAVRQVYEELLFAMEQAKHGPVEGNVSLSRALENLKAMKENLGPKGLDAYERLLEKGE